MLGANIAAARTGEHMLAAEQCLLLWSSLSSQPHDSSALISQLGEILPHLTPSHAIEFGPRARGSIIHALRSWQLCEVSRRITSATVVELRSPDRDQARLARAARDSRALADELSAKRPRPRSPRSA